MPTAVAVLLVSARLSLSLKIFIHPEACFHLRELRHRNTQKLLRRAARSVTSCALRHTGQRTAPHLQEAEEVENGIFRETMWDVAAEYPLLWYITVPRLGLLGRIRDIR